jgi:hypothetical protein
VTCITPYACTSVLGAQMCVEAVANALNVTLLNASEMQIALNMFLS